MKLLFSIIVNSKPSAPSPLRFNTSFPEDREIKRQVISITAVRFTCGAQPFFSPPRDNRVAHVSKTIRFSPDVSRPSFPLPAEGCGPRWAASWGKSAGIVRGLQGHGDTGEPSHWSVVREKKESLVFFTVSTEPCSLNFTEPEGNIEILQQLDSGVECNYLITVYLGFGIEVQVSANGRLELSPIVLLLLWGVGYTLDRSSVYHGSTYRETTVHVHSYTEQLM